MIDDPITILLVDLIGLIVIGVVFVLYYAVWQKRGKGDDR